MERTCRSPRQMPRRDTPWLVRPVARLASSSPTLALTPTSVLGPPPPTPPSTTPSATSAFHPYYLLSSSNSSPPAAVARLPPSPFFLGCHSGGCFWAPQLHAHATRYLDVHCTCSPSRPTHAVMDQPPTGDHAPPPCASPPRHAPPPPAGGMDDIDDFSLHAHNITESEEDT